MSPAKVLRNFDIAKASGTLHHTEKTNLICDIVDNVLLKRDIPFVYMNGYEIDSKNIGESFARMMLPMSKASFDESIKGLSTYCKYAEHGNF